MRLSKHAAGVSPQPLLRLHVGLTGNMRSSSSLQEMTKHVEPATRRDSSHSSWLRSAFHAAYMCYGWAHTSEDV